uniref:Uncharacterized protein n=1 Tax=Arundo donax TaxID=35708 RepID=A0A0A8ZCM1_ARUDO
MFSLDQLCQITFCVLITYHRFDILNCFRYLYGN